MLGVPLPVRAPAPKLLLVNSVRGSGSSCPRGPRGALLTLPVPRRTVLYTPRERHTRPKPGPRSHGSSPPPRRPPSDATRDPTTAELPKGRSAFVFVLLRVGMALLEFGLTQVGYSQAVKLGPC
jgi:hypothetical protein